MSTIRALLNLDALLKCDATRMLNGRTFAYIVKQNMKILESVVESCDSADASDEQYQEYVKKREVMAKVCDAVERNGGLQIPDANVSKFIANVATLDEEYKECLDKRKEFLDTEEEIELVKISHTDLPEDINVELFDLLELIIK